MSSVETARTRTFSWEDPLASAATGATMDGLDYLRLVASGELPPPQGHAYTTTDLQVR